MSGAHSILAPSDAERWSRCVGAITLSKGVPQIDKEYSASGTCSHWLLNQNLENNANLVHWLGKEMEFDGFKFTVDSERIDRVMTVAERVRSEPGRMWSERLVNTSPILGVPNQSGHADVVKLDDTTQFFWPDGTPYKGLLSVHDLKDGFIPVYAKNNLQGLCYTAGSLYELMLATEINAVRFCIHQPKLHHYDEWTYTLAEIEAFITIIRPVAKLAYDIYHGNVEFDADLHLNAGEEQCFWCPVRGSCPARARRLIEMFQTLISKHAISDDALAGIFVQLDEIEGACRDYRGEALRRALSGRKIEGHKLVKGRKGRRYWLDKGKAENALSLMLPEEDMYEPREVISPTQAETKLKRQSKTAYQSVQKYVGQEEGSLSLAPLDDKRDEVIVETFKPVLGA